MIKIIFLISLIVTSCNYCCISLAETTNHKTQYVSTPEKKPPKIRLHKKIVDTYGPLFQVTLWKDGNFRNKVVIKGGLNDLNKNGEISYPEADIKISIIEKTKTDTWWTIRVLPGKSYGVYEVEFPLLILNPISGPDHDRLIVPYQYGEVIENPFEKQKSDQGGRPRVKDAIWYGVYGSKMQVMQMILYENGDEGVMVWTQDPEGYIKDFEVSKDVPYDYKGPGVRCTVHHFPPNTGQPGAAWTSPYPVITSIYKDGWYNAAQKYRKWALKQRWCSKGTIINRIEQGDLPKWYMKNSLWLNALHDAQYDHLLKFHRLFPDVEICIFLTQWPSWKVFGVEIPKYFPPYNEERYKKVLSLNNNKIHFFPYLNVGLYDFNFKWDYDRLKKSFIEPPPDGAMIPKETADKFPYMKKYEEYWSPDRKSKINLKPN